MQTYILPQPAERPARCPPVHPQWTTTALAGPCLRAAGCLAPVQIDQTDRTRESRAYVWVHPDAEAVRVLSPDYMNAIASKLEHNTTRTTHYTQGRSTDTTHTSTS